MDIITTESALRKFLQTKATSLDIANNISLCGPTFDRVHQIDNDYIFEIESITNRVDTACTLGIARDAAAILPQLGVDAKLINDPYQTKTDLYSHFPKTFNFTFPKPDLVTRFTAITLTNVNIKESPQETMSLLTNCGMRPLNNAIDITNELTLLYGLPSHIFDLDKLAPSNLVIRESKKSEKITTLDDQVNTLSGGDIVIEDDSHRLVDLCGVMGGQVAEVDNHTKNILLIFPIYSPKKIRKTSLYLQKRTLASQIFEKSPDPELSLPLINIAIDYFQQRTGAEVSSSVFDYYPQPLSPKSIDLDLKWLTRIVGQDIPTPQVITILNSLGFTTSNPQDNIISCTVPSFRYYDINIPEDLVEEISRVYGYFRLPAIIPHVDTQSENTNPLLKNELKAKKFLGISGFHEIFNNSLISQELLNLSSLDIDKHLKLSNALSSDYQYLRTNIVPSLLQNFKDNQGKVTKPIRIFELSNVYIPTPDEELPQEISTLGVINQDGYLETKGILENLFRHLNLPEVEFTPAMSDHTYFDKSNTAKIGCQNLEIGYVGKIKPAILRNFSIDQKQLTAIEINFNQLVGFIKTNYSFTPISPFPEIIESVTITSSDPIGTIIKKIYTVNPLIKLVDYTNSYQDNHTFKIHFSSQTQNLDQNSIAPLKSSIMNFFHHE